MGVGCDEITHQDYNDDEPVSRRECYLHRQIIEKRVGGLESDMKEIKFELRSMKESNEKFYESVNSKVDFQNTKWDKLWMIVIAILILVAIGRLFDLDALVKLLI